MSPIAETVYISEDYNMVGNGRDRQNTTEYGDDMSDFSHTPVSEYTKNVSYYLKSDNSVNYSILDVEYDNRN
jgi:hypothetical protein